MFITANAPLRSALPHFFPHRPERSSSEVGVVIMESFRRDQVNGSLGVYSCLFWSAFPLSGLHTWPLSSMAAFSPAGLLAWRRELQLLPELLRLEMEVLVFLKARSPGFLAHWPT